MKSRSYIEGAQSVTLGGYAAEINDLQWNISQVIMTDFLPGDTSDKSKNNLPRGLPRSQGVTSFRHTTTTTTTDAAASSPSSNGPATPSAMHAPYEMQSQENDPSMLGTTTEMRPPSSPSSNAGEGSPWVGGTGLGSSSLGKSGKVIERLMAECDRLKRDLRSEVAKREELQRAAQTHKDRLESLHAENARLSNAKTMDDNMIKRRDRKIEELKNELDIERQKRESLESRVQDAERKQEEQEQHSNERLQRYLEEAKQATTSAAIYQTSHKQLREEYQQRIATSHRSLRELHDKREEDQKERARDRKKMLKIDVVNQQMSQELEKTRRAHNDLVAASERDREEKAAQVEKLLAELDTFRENDRRREHTFEQKLAEMQDTVNQMKWVMAVKKVSDENGMHSPPPSPPG
ncbi:hypothetical protein AAFC00_006237 [Neodothiora populina]|uniref:SWI5-dependent HO expression protein 3 n=1 Tax=Neodothiora populina TaxID=2781224 RepID=A0ABR3P4I7_9PEZI